MGAFDEIIIQDEKERLFTAYATVEIKDKQGQFVPMSNFKKGFYKFMARGAPLHWMHTNRVIGKVINGEEENLGEYKAFKITGLIYSHDDDVPDYDEAWEAIKSGVASGVSIGGGKPLLITKQNSKEGAVDELVTVPLLEISVVERPANPLALITGFSMAKSDNMAKPEGVDEAKWEEAKQKVHEQYPEITEDNDRFWALTQSIYQNMTKADSIDTVTFDIPLITRLFEFFAEEKVSDVELHKILENIIASSKVDNVLTMDVYDSVIQNETKQNNEEVAKMDEVNEQNPSEVIDLAKSLQAMSESMSKMYSMMEKMYSMMDSEVEKPVEAVEEEAEPVAPAVEEEVAKEVNEEEKPENAPEVAPETEEELEKDEPDAEYTEEKDVSEEVATEDEGEEMSKANKSKLDNLTKDVAELRKQLALKKSVTPSAPVVQPEGAVNNAPKSVWAMVLKEKGYN